MHMSHILIVDDDVDTLRILSELVQKEGFTTAVAPTLAEARRQIAMRPPYVILLDLVLPDGDGLALFQEVESEIILITGHASVETSVQALRLGAADYLVKPINIKQLKAVLSRIARPIELKAEINNLRGELRRLGHFGKMIGGSTAIQTVYDRISRVAPTSATVLVTGESGTGKELVAQTIHELSRRHKQTFLAVNCGAISPQLIESEIFGHEKGSFTGATRDHKGYFERANGGTLFLDEVTEMPLELQVKLLRVLETGMFMRVGSDKEIEIDVRIIAATNRIPEEAVAEGKMREDLMYRLQVFPIQVPPLRDRVEDIPLLANQFLNMLNEKEGTVKAISPSAIAALEKYHWPGNVRELKNIIQRAYIMANEIIDADALLPDLFNKKLPETDKTHKEKEDNTLSLKVGSTVEEMERQLIFATLEKCGGNKEKTAEILGVSSKTLYNRLRQYGTESSLVEKQ